MKSIHQILRVARGKRPPLINFGVTIVGVLLIAYLLLFKIALPLFVSTASVRANMERALSSWTGATATITGTPVIGFWPQPILTLQDVRFEGGDGQAEETLAKADAITARFDVLEALGGSPVFYDFTLVRPHFVVRRHANGELNWRRSGWMAAAVTSAAENETSAEQDTPIGEIEIEDGAVDIIDAIKAKTYRFSSVSGTIDWPEPAARISGRLNAMLNGESIDWSFSCNNPMQLLSGRSSRIETTVSSPSLSLAFQGDANGSAYGFASGRLQLSTPDVSKAFALFDRRLAPLQTRLSASVDTQMTALPGSLKMDDLSVSLNDMTGTGVLDITRQQTGQPRVDGTLAFGRMDIGTLAPALLPWLLGTASEANGLLDLVKLDLRLSAPEVRYGALTLGNIAAGIMADSENASIDIGDGVYAGGSLSGRVSLAGHGSGGGRLQMALRDADLGAVSAMLGLQGPLPIGRGIVSVDLTTTDPLGAATPDNMNGTLRLAMSDGTLTNFDRTKFQNLLADDAFFDIREAGGGSMPFSRADIQASFEQGVAEISRADIQASNAMLSLAGIVPYKNSSLALAGSLTPQAEGAVPTRFFVGGSWPNAIISPVTTIPATP